MRILALDVGTSSVKAAVLDVERGEPVGPVGRAAYVLDHPTPDAAEVPADRIWTAVTEAARFAVQDVDGIEAVGLSCLMPALLLLGSDERPVTPVWTHLDRRARPAARAVQADVGEEFLRTIGNRPLPGGISALCYRQMTADDPALPARVGSYLHLNGWLALRMTGEKAFDRANASFTGLFGTMTDREWSPRWCDYFGVSAAWLPRVVCGSTTLGSLREEAAANLGVRPGLPVKLGTADTSSAMLAAGMTADDLLHVVGTTQVLAVVTDTPVPDPRRLTCLLGVGNAYVQVAHNPVGGVALDWVHELCFADQPAEVFYGHTVPEALSRTTAVRLDPPFLGGDRLEIEPAFAALGGLSLSTGRLDVLTAVLTAMREQHVKALAGLGRGDKFTRIFLTGGGADVVRALLPPGHERLVIRLEEGSLRGVAQLFRQGGQVQATTLE